SRDWSSDVCSSDLGWRLWPMTSTCSNSKTWTRTSLTTWRGWTSWAIRCRTASAASTRTETDGRCRPLGELSPAQRQEQDTPGASLHQSSHDGWHARRYGELLFWLGQALQPLRPRRQRRASPVAGSSLPGCQ